MTDILKNRISRRSVLGAGLATAGVLAMPSILRAQEKSLKVGVYGGYFKKSFDENVFPDFTKATGIAIESIAEPTGEAPGPYEAPRHDRVSQAPTISTAHPPGATAAPTAA